MALLDQATLTDLYLFGVNLTNDDGVAYSPAMFSHLIEASTGLAKRVLDIPIGTTDYEAFTDEAHEADPGDSYVFKLDKGPLRSVTSLTLRYGNDDYATIPLNWVTILSDKMSEIQVIPSTGSIAYQALQVYYASHRPHRVMGQWRFSYTAGYKDSDAPAELKALVGLLAARSILITAGDLILGAGIATQSISVDGMSTSIGSTSSATNSGYGARLIENRKLIDEYIKVLKDTMRGPVFFAV